MRENKINRDEFLKLPTKEIARFVSENGQPKSGIFVPDGTRRMTLALTGKRPGSKDFFNEYLELTSRYFMENLDVFFSHGLKTLFVPVISSHVFNKSKTPHHRALRNILKMLFKGKDWLDFYKKNDIRVKVYGNLSYFAENNYEQVREWIEDIAQTTAANHSHTLFYGFASSNETEAGFVDNAIDFFEAHGRRPTIAEQLESYYGEHVPPAHFFIMSTKFTGLSALPPLIVNRSTRMFFLPVPGIMALTKETYRKIIFDFLYCCPGESRREYDENDLKYREQLRNYFSSNQAAVLGLGRRIGHFWVPVIETGESTEHEDEQHV